MENSNIIKEIDEKRQGEALVLETNNGQIKTKKLYLESYGCQMNFSDSEIVASILSKQGYSTTRDFENADLILLNTCAIRDNAELRVRNKLRQFHVLKRKKPGLIVGLLGCMAERLKSQLLEQEKLVDLVVGPDAYRDLPNLIEAVENGGRAVNVLLSREETHADIKSIELMDKLFFDTLRVGQNVDSYKWNMNGSGEILDPEKTTCNFAQLLEKVALVTPELRVRFSTSHPKDMTDDVLEIMAKYENICDYVHLPVQSGNSDILEKMNRGYTREWYLDRIAAIRRIIPGCGVSTDIITGFCTETDDQFADTVSLMNEVVFDFAYMFKYSERPKTLAERKYKDDIPEEKKAARLDQIIKLQQEHSHENNKKMVGNICKVLVEGVSKKSELNLFGRNSQNAVVVFPRGEHKKGDYVHVLIEDCSPATLRGKVVS